MTPTVKFTVSVPGRLYKQLEALRSRSGKSRSQLVREALRRLEPLSGGSAGGLKTKEAGVREEPARYGGRAASLREITDPVERRRRAIAAAGRFRSGLTDLSKEHDKYLDDAYAVRGSELETGPGRKP